MSNLAGQPVRHPSWCDPGCCTAPETYPTSEEYTGPGGERHRSTDMGDVAQEIYLTQSIAPWSCNTYLHIASRNAATTAISVCLEFNSGAVWAILAHVADYEFPSLLVDEASRRGIAWRPLTADDPSLSAPRLAGELDDGGALNDAGRDYAEEDAQRAAAEREGQEENAAASKLLHSPRPGQATTMTRCGMALNGWAGPRTALLLSDVTCIECLELVGQQPAERDNRCADCPAPGLCADLPRRCANGDNE